MSIRRVETYAAGALVERIEGERVAGNVQVRRYNGAGQLVETRTGTADEAASFTDWESADRDSTNGASLRDKAAQALTANAAFLAIATPTAAQNAAQAKALTRQTNGIIRLLLGRLDDVSDT